MKESIKQIGHFKRLISDREGFTESPGFIKLLDEHNIKHIITSAPSGFAERMVKTFKDYVHDRIEGLKMGKEQWVQLVPGFLKYYNYTPHSTTKERPIDAMKPQHKINVMINIRKRAQFNRAYEPLEINDLVRIYIKQTITTKNRDPKFSNEVYKIIFKK